MEKIIIGSFNLKNPYTTNFLWNDDETPKQLANFIKNNNINFLCTQELVKKFSHKLQKELGKTYTITGDYRLKKIPLTNKINESNGIITNEPIIHTETKHLSLVPIIDHLTLFPRIITSVETPEHFIINTHLEFLNEYSKKHQLKKLYNYIITHLDKNPIITGDFNMDTSKEYFQEFINSLEQLGIKHINNSTPTYYTKEQILDHIFIPSNYKIENVAVIKNQEINKISDHRPIIVKIRKKI